MSLHCIRGCIRRGRHLSDCEDRGNCSGCEPKLAAVGQLCITDHARLTENIGRIPDLIAHIREHVEPGAVRRDSDSMVKSTRTPPAPLALDAVDGADGLYATLNAWHDTATDELDLTPLKRRGWTTTTGRGQIAGLRAGGTDNDSTAIAGRLLAHLERVCQYEWVGDMATEISDAVRAALKRWPLEERPIYLPTPCPACDMLSLTRYAPQTFEGKSVISCRACGAAIAEDLYDWQTRRVLIAKHNEAEAAQGGEGLVA